MGDAKIEYDDDLLDYYINLFREKFADVPQLTTQQYQKMLERGWKPVVLDARSEEEYSFSWLRGAIWCPDTVTDDQLTELLSKFKGRRVVCHCGAGGRGNVLAQRVEKLKDTCGLKKVFNLEGGVFKWVNEGRTLVGPRGQLYAARALNVGVFDRAIIGLKERVYVDSVTAAQMVKPDVVFIPMVVWSML